MLSRNLTLILAPVILAGCSVAPPQPESLKDPGVRREYGIYSIATPTGEGWRELEAPTGKNWRRLPSGFRGVEFKKTFGIQGTLDLRVLVEHQIIPNWTRHQPLEYLDSIRAWHKPFFEKPENYTLDNRFGKYCVRELDRTTGTIYEAFFFVHPKIPEINFIVGYQWNGDSTELTDSSLVRIAEGFINGFRISDSIPSGYHPAPIGAPPKEKGKLVFYHEDMDFFPVPKIDGRKIQFDFDTLDTHAFSGHCCQSSTESPHNLKDIAVQSSFGFQYASAAGTVLTNSIISSFMEKSNVMYSLDVPPGLHSVTISDNLFSSKTLDVTVTDGQTRYYDIYWKADKTGIESDQFYTIEQMASEGENEDRGGADTIKTRAGLEILEK